MKPKLVIQRVYWTDKLLARLIKERKTPVTANTGMTQSISDTEMGRKSWQLTSTHWVSWANFIQTNARKYKESDITINETEFIIKFKPQRKF